MTQRLINMIELHICESIILFYDKQAKINSFSSMSKFCTYYSNFILNPVNGSGFNTAMNLQLSAIEYIHAIYGFSDDDAYPLVYNFFKNKRWLELEDISRYMLKIHG